MINKGVDNIVLGCTHYPFLIPIIKELIPSTIKIIDSGKAVAKRTQYILEKEKLLNKTKSTNSHLFYTNKDQTILNDFMKRIRLKADDVDYNKF